MAIHSPPKRLTSKQRKGSVASTRSRRQKQPSAKLKAHKFLEELPVDSVADVLQFMEFLRFKVAGKPKRPVKLGGIWAGAHLDNVDEKLRRLRRENIEHLEEKYDLVSQRLHALQLRNSRL